MSASVLVDPSPTLIRGTETRMRPLKPVGCIEGLSFPDDVADPSSKSPSVLDEVLVASGGVTLSIHIGQA